MTSSLRRIPIKARSRSDRESSLQRLREECSERFASEREALRERLRASLDGALEGVIRNEIKSIETDLEQVDIDRLVEEFLQELARESPPTPEEEDIDIDEISHPDWVRCPLCFAGWIVMPISGILACDHCPVLRLAVAAEGFTVHDFACTLDSVIRNHQLSGCPEVVGFRIEENVLFAVCNHCNKVEVVT